MGCHPFVDIGHPEIERQLEEFFRRERIIKRAESGMPEMSIRSREDAEKVFELRNKWNVLQRKLCEAMADEVIICRENSCYDDREKKMVIERREALEAEIEELEKEMEKHK